MVEFNTLEITSDGKYLIIDVSVKDKECFEQVYLDSLYIDTLSTYCSDGTPSNKAYKQQIGEVTINGNSYLPIQIENTGTSEIVYRLPFRIEQIGNYAIRFGSINNPNLQVTIIDSANRSFNVGTFYNTFGTSYDWLLKYDKYSNTVSTISKWYPEDPSVFYGQKYLSIELDIKDLLFLINSNKIDSNPLFVVYIKTKGTPSPDTPCGEDSEYTIGIALNKCPLLNCILEAANELNNTCKIPKVFIDKLLQYEAFLLAVKLGNTSKAVQYWKEFFDKPNFKTSINTCKCNGL